MTVPVDLVLVHYRCPGPIRALLARLAAEDPGRRYRVTLVDNDEPGTLANGDILRTDADPVRFIRSGTNVGFARAANRGAAGGQAPWILFLNPDVVPFPGVLARLPGDLAGSPGLAFPEILGGVTVTPEDRRPGGGFPSLAGSLLGRIGRRGRFPPGAGAPDRARPDRPGTRSYLWPVDWVAGSFLAIRRSRFEALGGFDEAFFLYFEDVDLCRRAHGAGVRAFLHGAWRHHHPGHGSFGGDRRAQARLYRAGQACYLERHGGALHRRFYGIYRWFRRDRPERSPSRLRDLDGIAEDP